MMATVEDGVVVVVCVPLADGAADVGAIVSGPVGRCVATVADGAADVGAIVSGPVGRCVVTVAVGSAVVDPCVVVVAKTNVVEPCTFSVTIEGNSEVVVSCPAVAVVVVLSVDVVTISGAFVVGVTGSTGGGDCHARIRPA